MSKERDDNKVIPFPTPDRMSIAQRIQAMDLKKFTASATLASVLFVIPLLNGIQVNNAVNNEASVRGVASLGSNSVYQSQREPLSPELIEKLANESVDSLAAVGHRPSELDNLEYGVLSGAYNLNLNDNHQVSNLLVKENSPLANIEDSQKFLKKHKDLWSVQFASIHKHSDVTMGGKRSEIYTLMDDSSRPVGKATVLSNANGGMISFAVVPQ